MKQTKSITKKNLRFSTVFQREPEGGFTVTIPVLPGCVTFGKTLEEAEKMAGEAIQLYLEDMLDTGELLPPQKNNTYIGEVEVAVSSHKRRSLIHA